jgi:hypothetical protein
MSNRRKRETKMSKLLTTTAMILALGAATPALADGYNNNHGFNNQPNHTMPAPAPQAPAFQHTAKFDRDMNAWERGWSPIRIDVRFGNHQLTRAQILNRLQAQGYNRVYELTPARFGSWRAVAFYRGHQVVLRVDQFTGRVLASRYI